MVEVWFFAAAFLAEVIGTVAGFGSSTIFLPLALLFFDFKTAIVLVAVFHLFGNLGRLSFFRKGIDINLAIKFGVPSVLLTLAGSAIVSYGNVQQDLLTLILGVFLVAYAILSLAKPKFKIQPTNLNAFTGGTLSGFLAGLIGTGGAVRGAFLTAFKTEKEKYIATAALVAIAVDLTRLPVYIAGGLLKPEHYALIPILLVIAIAASFTGRNIISQINQETFRKIVLAAVGIAGLKLSIDAAQVLLA